METFSQIERFIEKNQIQMVDLKYCDLWGRWHHITIPAVRFKESIMEEGVGFDGSSVGLKSVKSGDMVLIPDLQTGVVDPFWEVPTMMFICTTYEADTHMPFAHDPRCIAQRAEDYLRLSGCADESLWGPEFEFYIFNQASFSNSIHKTGYEFACEQVNCDQGAALDGYYLNLEGGYHAMPPRDRTANLRSAMSLHLEAMGVPIKYHHHEVGGPGQVEIETPLMKLTQAGDAAMLIKYVARMSAVAAGKTVTFMPKPMYGVAGNGMHFHQQLRLADTNLFYDATGYGLLSQTALYYIGGLLKHGSALLALTNPSTNSYRRLVPGYEAPISAFFSLGNRSAAIRIPEYARQPHNVRMEFRPPDATCNVYMALAAQLLAGLDGIKNRIDPTAAGFGPIDADVFSWTSEQRQQIKYLPTSLESALSALEQDQQFLLAGDVFSEELLDQWVMHKRSQEVEPVRNRPHPYEMALYYDV